MEFRVRILHISQSMDPRWGGPPKITACIASSQAAIGHEVSIAARAEHGREDSIKALLGTIPGMDKVAMELLEPVSPLREILSYKAGDGLEELVRSSDVVHIHNVWDPFNIPAAKLARKHSKPHYILLNGMLDPWCMNEKRLKKNILMKLRWREFLDGATALHCGNRDEIELIKPLGLTAPREMIPNGVFPDEIAPPTEDAGFFKDHPELADLKIMLFMSRLHHKKGLDHLAESFAIFARDNDDVHLVVAGPEEGSGDDFRARISRHGIDHRVHMVGPVYGPQKWQLLHASECFVLTSHQEGFSVDLSDDRCRSERSTRGRRLPSLDNSDGAWEHHRHTRAIPR